MRGRDMLLGRRRKEDADRAIDDQNEDQSREKIDRGEHKERCHLIVSKLPAGHKKHHAATIVITVISRSSI